MQPILLHLQRSTKESLKTALAMVLVYAIALQMDWGKPVWAGLAVAMVSQSALGLSLNKAGLRMLGTFLAVAVAFLLIALFPQARWIFMVALSLWLGLCTYMALGSQHSYFWRVGGFVSAIICVSAVTASTGAFEIGMLRAQQTGLGILVYSLVALLIWPNSSRDSFLEGYTALQAAQLAVFREYRVSLSHLDLDAGGREKLLALRAQLLRAQSNFEALLESAIADSYGVWESRRQWQDFAAVSGELTEILLQLGESLQEVVHLPVNQVLPNVDTVCDHIDQRLQAVSPTAPGNGPGPSVVEEEIRIDTSELKKLGILDSATLALFKRLLSGLDQRTIDLGRAATEIWAKDRPGRTATPTREKAFSELLMPDPDRLAGVLRVIVTVWLAYLGYIYIEGLPAGPLLIGLAASLSISLTQAPFISPMRLFLPVGLSIVFAGLIYLLLLPHFSEFWQLGLVLFAATFLICQLFADPAKAAGKAIGLSFFLSILNIANTQTYSFMVVANISVLVTVLLVLLAITAYLPFSPRPERMFQRQLNHFLRSCEILLNRLVMHTERNAAGSPGETRKRMAWRTLYHRHIITQTPARLSLLASFIDKRYFPDTGNGGVQELIGKVEALGTRITAIVDAGFDAPGAAAKSSADVAAYEWCEIVRAGLRQLSLVSESSGKGAFSGAEFQARQRGALADFETSLRASTGGQTIEAATEQRLERLLSLLGLARSISLLLVSLSQEVGEIDWRRWKETTFF